MWPFQWQTIVALICVAAAAVGIIWRARRWLSGAASSGCHGCPARQDKEVVPLSSLKLSPSLKARRQSQGSHSDIGP